MSIRCSQQLGEQKAPARKLPRFPDVPPAWIIPHIDKKPKKDDRPQPGVEFPPEPMPQQQPPPKEDEGGGGVVIIRIAKNGNTSHQRAAAKASVFMSAALALATINCTDSQETAPQPPAPQSPTCVCECKELAKKERKRNAVRKSRAEEKIHQLTDELEALKRQIRIFEQQRRFEQNAPVRRPFLPQKKIQKKKQEQPAERQIV